MQLREKIHNAINKLPADSLTLIYEQIKIIEKNRKHKQNNLKTKIKYSIHQVQKMTKTSKTNWSDAVIEERNDRV